MMMLLLLWVPAEIIPVARGAGRHEDTYVKVVISAVAIVVSWTLLLGAPSLALIMIQCRYQQQYTSKAISYGVHVLLRSTLLPQPPEWPSIVANLGSELEGMGAHSSLLSQCPGYHTSFLSTVVCRLRR